MKNNDMIEYKESFISKIKRFFTNIFKKNKIVQARIFYILLIFGLSYLVCSFIYDFLYMIK